MVPPSEAMHSTRLWAAQRSSMEHCTVACDLVDLFEYPLLV